MKESNLSTWNVAPKSTSSRSGICRITTSLFTRLLQKKNGCLCTLGKAWTKDEAGNLNFNIPQPPGLRDEAEAIWAFNRAVEGLLEPLHHEADAINKTDSKAVQKAKIEHTNVLREQRQAEVEAKKQKNMERLIPDAERLLEKLKTFRLASLRDDGCIERLKDAIKKAKEDRDNGRNFTKALSNTIMLTRENLRSGLASAKAFS